MAKSAIKVKVEGLKEVQYALRKLPDAVAKRVMRKIMRRRLKPIATDMKSSAPELSGNLRKSIRVGSRLSRSQRRKHRKADRSDVELFAGAGPLPQAHMSEFGTENTTAQPWARPVWDRKKGTLLPGLRADFWAEIRKEVAKGRKTK